MFTESFSDSPSDQGMKGKRPSSYRVLLAEDCPDYQLLIAHILRGAGANVTVVSNGEECAQAALSAWNEETPFDLVLVDILMPRLDGYGATRRLRDQGYPHRIVSMTARCTPFDQQESSYAGCDAHVSKIQRRSELSEELTNILSDPITV